MLGAGIRYRGLEKARSPKNPINFKYTKSGPDRGFSGSDSEKKNLKKNRMPDRGPILSELY